METFEQNFQTAGKVYPGVFGLVFFFLILGTFKFGNDIGKGGFPHPANHKVRYIIRYFN